MANKEQLVIVRKGAAVWNKWRAKNRETKINLRKANLHQADLSGVDLSQADLSEAGLVQADLSEADFREATLIWTDLAEANLTKANLTHANLGRAILTHSNLRGAILTEVDLGAADLRAARLDRADLSLADLMWADLRATHFNGADLHGANLLGARINEADLDNADFHEANLSQADFHWAVFGRANLSGATAGGTLFVDVDLSQVKGLDKVSHSFPSTVGIDTIYMSKGMIPEVFLRGCGITENFITFMRSLAGRKRAFEFYSCFISHSAKDKRFCERLYADLQSKGVRAWLFEEDAKWGETIWGEIDRGIRIYDKLIIVCSENSLTSGPVNREIERALVREDAEHKSVLFPITVDDFVFSKDPQGNNKWQHPRRADLLAKVVGDFSGWDKDAAKYDKAFDKLLKGLQAESTV